MEKGVPMNMLIFLIPLGGLVVFITMALALTRLGIAISNNQDDY